MHKEIERLHNLGYKLVAQKNKVPIMRWKNGVDLDELIETVERERAEIAILTGQSGVTVVDGDDAEAVDCILHELPKTPQIAKTSRGIHAYYQGIVPIVHQFRGMKIDILSSNSTATLRRWISSELPLRVSDLPEFPKELIVKKEEVKTEIIPLVSDNIESVRRYIRKITAVSGQRGHASTFRAACKLADAGLTEEQVLAELIAWNETNTFPKWSWRELEHKARDACRRKR